MQNLDDEFSETPNQNENFSTEIDDGSTSEESLNCNYSFLNFLFLAKMSIDRLSPKMAENILLVKANLDTVYLAPSLEDDDDEKEEETFDLDEE
jgi:hypothetical protein